MKTARIILSLLWSSLLALAGMWLLTRAAEIAAFEPPRLVELLRVLGVLSLCGSQFILSVLVLEDLCPRALDAFKSVVRSGVGLAVWVHALWAGSLLWAITRP